MQFLRHSIRNQLIVFLLVATIVPIGLSMYITYIYTKESLKDRAVAENTQLIYQGRTNLLNFTDTLSAASLSLYSDRALHQLLDQGLTDYESESRIYNGLQNMARNVKDTYQIYLDAIISGRSYLFIQDNFKRSGPTAGKSGREITVPYAAYMEPAHPSHDYGIQQLPYYSPESVITLHRPIHSVPSTRLIGFLSIDVRLDTIRRIAEQLMDEEKEQLYIIDSDGQQILAAGRMTDNQRPSSDEPWVQHLLKQSTVQGSFEWSTDTFKGIVVYDKMITPYMNWSLVKRIPYDHLYENARTLTFINMLVALLCLLIAIAATVAVSIRLTSPIKHLIRQMNAIQTGRMDTRMEINREDEIGQLSRRFQAMMDTINELIMREYKLALANKTNQLKALQAQINPHFLNNALQSIGTLALQHQAPNVYALLASLAKMMHYSMQTNEPLVPLSAELTYLKHYMDLQKQRFRDKLVFSCTIGEGTEAVMVPKMIIQPIAENYFKHGQTSQNKGGILTVTTKLMNNRLFIQISDNGAGMSTERLHKLQMELDGPEIENRQNHIGLANVMDRLRLYYGTEASIQLLHVNPSGLSVVLTIPSVQEGDPV
jgi:two-component system sensor histidine kinase YesM